MKPVLCNGLDRIPRRPIRTPSSVRCSRTIDGVSDSRHAVSVPFLLKPEVDPKNWTT